MKKLLWAGLLGLLLAALPSRVHAVSCCVGGWRFNAGINVYLSCGPNLGPQAGPWYLYWPLEAHFQPPAPTCYPYWPSPMTLPAGGVGGVGGAAGMGGIGALGGVGHPPMPMVPPQLPPLQAAPLQPSAVRPVNYTPEAPSYWYGR